MENSAEVIEQFKVEEVFTAEEIRQIKEFMTGKCARDNRICISHLCALKVNSMTVHQWIPDKYKNVFCSLYKSLEEFFSDYLRNNPLP